MSRFGFRRKRHIFLSFFFQEMIIKVNFLCGFSSIIEKRLNNQINKKETYSRLTVRGTQTFIKLSNFKILQIM